MELSDNSSDDFGTTHSTIQNYFTNGIDDEEQKDDDTSNLSLNNLSRDQLSSLSKEQLIELLTKGNYNQNPVSQAPPKNRNRKEQLFESKNKKKIIQMTASYHNPTSDSQSEQPSEKRNRKVCMNPLSPEQEERETPQSEPESDSDGKILDTLMSSTDSDLILPPPQINPNLRYLEQFEDIASVERSVDSPRSDDISLSPKFNIMETELPKIVVEHNTSSDSANDKNNQKELPLITKSNSVVISSSKNKKSRKSKRKSNEKSNEKSQDKSNGEKFDESEIPPKLKKKRFSLSNVYRSKSDSSKFKKDDNISLSEGPSPKGERIMGKKKSKLDEPEIPIKGAFKRPPKSVNNSKGNKKATRQRSLSEGKQYLQPPMNYSEEEEDEDSSDSYDTDDIREVGIVHFQEKKPKQRLKQKSKSHEFSPISEEVELKERDDPYDDKDDNVIRDGDDPRRYVTIGFGPIPKQRLVGKQIESVTGRKIKQDLEAQKLRRFISVGSGLDERAVRSELKLKQAEISAVESKGDSEDG